ncbi:reverse transcriptase domain-containing protein [Tanacetum coccineum]|uniref:Reverse transcriptase domain-containing protein n=1 Tax=Tanacetum coccineum TaxID=301880 RepID=A0ABQ4YSJ4_9ASTR
MVERESDSRRPSERRIKDGGSHGGNLPLLLTAHLGRSENGQPLQSNLTSEYVGNHPSTNSGGNLLPNDGLKMPSHVGSSDEKGDLDNYLHLFEGSIHMQKWAMPVACHMFTYTIKDSARIWRNGQKAGSIVNYEDLKAKFWSHFSKQKKFTKTHLAVHNIKQRDGESTRAFVTRYTNDTLQMIGLHEEQRIFGFVHGLKTRSLMEFLFTDLPTTYNGLMKKPYTWTKANEVATNRSPSDHKEGFDMFSKGSLHIIGIKKGKEKASDIQLGKWKKGDKYIVLVEAPILMISRGSPSSKRKSVEELGNETWEITFPSVSSSDNSSDPVIIRAQISIRQVNRVYMDSGNSCEESIPDLSERSLWKSPRRGKDHRQGRAPEQTVVIGKQLPTNFKRKLQDLMRSNVDVFTWTYTDMTRIPRTIMVEGKSFNTKHKLNEYKHIEPVKQKKRGLAPERNEAACKELDELKKVGILQEVKDLRG